MQAGALRIGFRLQTDRLVSRGQDRRQDKTARDFAKLGVSFPSKLLSHRCTHRVDLQSGQILPCGLVIDANRASESPTGPVFAF